MVWWSFCQVWHSHGAHYGVGQKQFKSSGSNATTTQQSVLTLKIVLLLQTQLFRFPTSGSLWFCNMQGILPETFFWMSAKSKTYCQCELFEWHFYDQHVNFEKLPTQSIILRPLTLKVNELWSCTGANYNKNLGLAVSYTPTWLIFTTLNILEDNKTDKLLFV